VTRTRVIIVSVVGVVAVFVGLWAMTSGGGAGQSVEAVFSNVTGLVNHSVVLHKGVRVGEVTSIEPYGKGGEKALLRVAFDPDVDLTLRKDAGLVLRLKSVLGEMFLDLDPGKSPEPLEGGRITRTHRDTSLDRLVYAGAGIARDLQAAEETRLVVNELRALVESSGGDVLAITANTRKFVDGLSTRAAALSTIIANLDALTSGTEGNAGALGGAIVTVRDTLVSVRGLLERNQARIEALIRLLDNVISEADPAVVDRQLAQAADYVDKIYQGIRIMHAVLNHDIPALGFLIAVPASLPDDFYGQIEAWSKNPVLRKVLIRILEGYLGS
jgi:virulence factor Mce-like protein